ncbi:MAG: hypothetical protein HZB55_21865 [Deltaproteobacteria bacterium]|nr:hypothetical protein [Deltaproteobacteria bacterium]
MKPTAALCLAALLSAGAALGVEVSLSVAPGRAFPDFSFDELVDPEDYGSLGLATSTGPVRLSQVPGDLLVLEFFSARCLNCQRQAPLLDSFFRAVASGDLAGRVRLLGVGVGSGARELGGFRRALKVTYPMAADPTYDRYLELGDPGGTPFTLFLLRQSGQWTLADSHFGLEGDTELMARSRVLLEGKAGAPPALTAAGRSRSELPLSDEEQHARAQHLLAGLLGRDAGVDTVEIPGHGRLFRALGSDGKPIGLYARFASREPVCDLCHAIHFLFAFDDKGTVRGFEAVRVTKFGNELWSEADAEKLRSRMAGRTLDHLTFDPNVDAVTSGTMSSSLIFDEVRRAAALVAALPKP